MLRIIWGDGLRPAFFSLDGTDTFDRGMVAQLKAAGNEVVVGVSDGTSPLGLIDDVRATSFLQPQRDEVVVIAATGIAQDDGSIISTSDVKGELDYASIIRSSFRLDEGPDVSLNTVNGVVTVPAGSKLNYDSDDDGTNDSFRLVCSYYYRVPEIPGDDSTDGSGKVTVWIGRGIYSTDQYDMNAQYYLNARLYVGLDGKLTANQPTADHPQVAFVTGPPSGLVRDLEFFWF